MNEWTRFLNDLINSEVCSCVVSSHERTCYLLQGKLYISSKVRCKERGKAERSAQCETQEQVQPLLLCNEEQTCIMSCLEKWMMDG
jgi:hypothetical protein